MKLESLMVRVIIIVRYDQNLVVQRSDLEIVTLVGHLDDFSSPIF